MNHTKGQLTELIEALPDDQRNEIAELLQNAASAINNVECLLIPTPLNHSSLIIEDLPTLLCNIYTLIKMFTVIAKAVDATDIIIS